MARSPRTTARWHAPAGARPGQARRASAAAAVLYRLAALAFGGASLVAVVPAPALAEPQQCQDVSRAVGQLAVEVREERILLRLAPYIDPDTSVRLLARATSADEDGAFAAYLAAGLARHAETLRALRALPEPSSEPKRLARALGLLALGDGVATATVARVLVQGSAPERRRVARALARMPQRRPRMMMLKALDDGDEEVRFLAGRALLDVDPRGRRVLLDLMRSGSPAIQRRAAHALLRWGHVFRGDEMALFSVPERVQWAVADAVRGRRANLRQLGQLVRSGDEHVRTEALAVQALVGGDQGAATLHKLEKMLAGRQNAPVSPELSMALVLSGDTSALKGLGDLDRPGVARAIAVLWAFAGGGAKSQLEPDHAQQLAHVVEGWVHRGLVEEDDAARAMRALEGCDPLAGLIVARVRLGGPEGPGLRTALRVMGRSGQLADLSALAEIGRRGSIDVRSEAWRAAARICQR